METGKPFGTKRGAFKKEMYGLETVDIKNVYQSFKKSLLLNKTYLLFSSYSVRCPCCRIDPHAKEAIMI